MSKNLDRYSADPIGLHGGINLYAYCLNDPVNRIDIEGEFGTIVGYAIGAAIAVGVSYFGAKIAASFVSKEASDGVDMAMGKVAQVKAGEVASMAVGEVVGTAIGARIGAATKCTTKNNIKKAADAVVDYIGPNSKPALNEAGDLVIESADGFKKVRFDINHTNPHKNPHGHVEEFKRVKNKMKPTYKSGPIYPKGVPHE